MGIGWIGDMEREGTMKKKLRDYFSEKYPAGTIVEIDDIRKDSGYASGYKVRVINLWKRPKWIALSWVVNDD